MNKPEECKDCFLYKEPGPVPGEFTNSEVDVVFVAAAPNRHAVRTKKPFTNHILLRSSIKEIGVVSFGITTAWKCQLEGMLKQTTSPDVSLHPYCLKWLLEQLTIHRPKMVVPLGNAAYRIFTNRVYDVFKEPGKTGVAERVGDFLITPMMHPEMTSWDKGKWKGAWNEGFNKLREVLNGIKQ